MSASASSPVDTLLALLRPQRLTAVVDVGANPIDGDTPYKSMLGRRLCTVTGFEPQPEGLASLNARRSDLETYLPYVIGDGSPATLHIAVVPGMTSLFDEVAEPAADAPDPGAERHFAGEPARDVHLVDTLIPDIAVAIQELPVPIIVKALAMQWFGGCRT